MIIETLLTVLQFVPLLFLLWLANLAEGRRTSELASGGRGFIITTYTLLLFVLGGLLLFGVLLILLGNLLQHMPLPPETQAPLPSVGQLDHGLLTRMGLSWAIPALLGMLLLIPYFRRALSRLLPIDPENRVHTVALASSMLIGVYFFSMVAIGLDKMVELTSGLKESNPLPSMWAQQMTFFLLAVIGVGWLSRRDFLSALHRLGIVRPNIRQILIGIGTGLMLVVIALVLENAARMLGFPTDPYVEKLTRQLIGPMYGSVWGILTLGLAAALGEESIFRGALLPRFGLFFTTLLFALVHSNYGLSLSTLIVFVVGLILGIIRKRYNTSTSMVVHATYNITLGILAGLSINF
jgi:uncharacterized protein